MSTRTLLLTSWHAARRASGVSGAVTLTAASFAGYALEAVGGDVTKARELVPIESEAFWGRVHEALNTVENEERPLRAVGGGS